MAVNKYVGSKRILFSPGTKTNASMRNIIATKVDVTKKEWILFDAIVTELDNSSNKYKNIKFKKIYELIIPIFTFLLFLLTIT